MNVALSILFFLIIFLLIEVLAIIFKITGLEISKARFQIISILTHTGFTTRESELIVQHPIRRKIASILMVVSYVGQATLISLIISVFTNRNNTIVLIIIVLCLFIVAIFVLRNRHTVNAFENLLEKYIKKQMKSKTKNKTIDEVLNLNNEFGVAEITIDETFLICGKTLSESKLKDKYIQVLTIDRGSHIIHFPRASFKFQEADKVTVYGKIEGIKEFIGNISK
ncbi:TrkA C-terminal domain-containing protein [Clostridium grantii]|uniref:TrkA-C domain-containing protein n=1 Tax=Clostridium grantii DSM 8605 TaxID=1121316 RepID=A0A1M5X1H0_9CLOT|nr:TrkA C-terminal domain-containing protein [Clostridium grantii]SHH93717.1 TrkA-C domain-containing protein [Clostridium grantii DSM 8605]